MSSTGGSPATWTCIQGAPNCCNNPSQGTCGDWANSDHEEIVTDLKTQYDAWDKCNSKEACNSEVCNPGTCQ